MKTKQYFKAPWGLGVMVLATISFAFFPGQIWALDIDRDGLEDALESTGFTLSSGFELWDTAEIDVPGSSSPNGLNPDIPDLFVIVRLATPSNFDPLRIEEYFAFATAPVADGGLGFKVWVLRETAGTPPGDRQFSPAAQKAPLLIEDLDTSGFIQGVAQYASIMTENKGIARVYSQRVFDSIDTTCAGADTCIDASGGSELKFKHLQWVVIHEVMHVIFSLDNSLRRVEGHHLTRGEYVMMPAVVITDKRGEVTYHIPGAFSSSAVDNWQFYQ
jgi:hypothetical protein